MNKISNQDRSRLIRLASQMPKGSEMRRAILAGISLVAADDKVKVRRKDTGKVVEVSKENAKSPEYEAIKDDGGKGKSKGNGKSVSDVKVTPDSLPTYGKDAWKGIDDNTKKQVEKDIKALLSKHKDDPQALVDALEKESEDWKSNRDASAFVFAVKREYEKALGVEAK